MLTGLPYSNINTGDWGTIIFSTEKTQHTRKSWYAVEIKYCGDNPFCPLYAGGKPPFEYLKMEKNNTDVIVAFTFLNVAFAYLVLSCMTRVTSISLTGAAKPSLVRVRWTQKSAPFCTLSGRIDCTESMAHET